MEDGKRYIISSFMICTLHQILTVIKSRRMKWAEHVTHMGQMGNESEILAG